MNSDQISEIEAFAQVMHDIWVEVEVATPEGERRICRWAQLSPEARERYRKMAATRWETTQPEVEH